jgi:hypothetical protein
MPPLQLHGTKPSTRPCRARDSEEQEDGRVIAELGLHDHLRCQATVPLIDCEHVCPILRKEPKTTGQQCDRRVNRSPNRVKDERAETDS